MANEQQPDNTTLDDLDDDQVTLESQQQAEPADVGAASEIETLKQELQQAKEQALRITAEMQNIRRRAELDIEKAHKFGLEKLINDMLPVADNLERTVAAAAAEGADIATLVEGVELTLKALLDGLKRHNVVAIDPEGEPFNPEFHQAMTMVPSPDVEPNTVLNVFQKGYTLHGRLVRPAMVVVSRAVQ